MVRRYAFIFDVELTLKFSERDAGCGYLPAVDQRRVTIDADGPAPFSSPDEGAKLVLAEQPQ